MTTPGSSSTLPLFYRSPMLLRSDAHGTLGLRRDGDFSFSAGAAAMPLVASEFAAASRHYPIVFANDDSAVPLVVLGVSAGQNLFVDERGQWRAGAYVPAYARRYPFIGMTDETGGPLMLGVDSASARLASHAEANVEPFFDSVGAPTEASRAAMTFCEAYAREGELISAFVQALKDNALLVERAVRIRYDDLPEPPAEADGTPGAHAIVNGFKLVDEAAFRALPAQVIAEFHAKGWSDLIVLHLASQLSWQGLVSASAPARAEAA